MDETREDQLPMPSMEETFESMASRRAQQLSVPRSSTFSRQQVIHAFEDAFHLIGGIPRLAHWGHENPGDFFKLYAKLLPSSATKEISHSGDIRILHAIQPTSLDQVSIDKQGNVIDVE